MGKTYEVSELGDMLIYQNEKGDTKVDVYFFEVTIQHPTKEDLIFW